MEEKYLVVGAVLLDLIGTTQRSQNIHDNKMGDVTIAIGGAAFNVAANLAAKGYKTSLFTCLQRDSLTTDLIKQGLAHSGIQSDHILDVETAKEPIYIAVYAGDELVAGVTSSPIESVDIEERGVLARALQVATLLVVDTNLSSLQIQRLTALAKQYDKPMVVGVVSDAKVSRVLNTKFAKKFEFVSLNANEAKAAGFAIAELNNPVAVSALCKALNTETVIVSMDREGHRVLKLDGSTSKFSAPVDARDTAPVGAGDALLSAACCAWRKYQDLESEQSQAIIRSWVASVIEGRRPNLSQASLQRTKSKFKPWSWIALACLLFAVLLVAMAMFASNISPMQFGSCLFGSWLLGGVTGALNRRIIHTSGSLYEASDTEYIAIGALAGFVAGLMSAVPHFSVFTSAMSGGVLSESIKGLQLVPPISFLLSVAAGVGFDLVLRNVRKDIESMP